jgi:hypothetical protein
VPDVSKHGVTSDRLPSSSTRHVLPVLTSDFIVQPRISFGLRGNTQARRAGRLRLPAQRRAEGFARAASEVAQCPGVATEVAPKQ